MLYNNIKIFYLWLLSNCKSYDFSLLHSKRRKKMKTAIQGATLYKGIVNGKSVTVQKETRFATFGDPNGHKVPVDGLNITAKDKDNGIVTAETFLAYAGLSRDPKARREKIAETISSLTETPKVEAPEVKDKEYRNPNYQCGRDSHEAYLY